MSATAQWSGVGLDTGYVYIVGATALSGMGLGIASPALTSLMAGSVAETDLGVAGAMQQLMTQLGAVLGSAVFATISVSASHGNFQPFHFAFIGDLPYTPADSANMPAFVTDINNDTDVQFVAHAGHAVAAHERHHLVAALNRWRSSGE